MAENAPKPPLAYEPTEDVYFSADVETDGPIPGPFSMLSFAIVYAGRFDGRAFRRPPALDKHVYAELRPISSEFDAEALRVNRLDRERLAREGQDPRDAMSMASAWIRHFAGSGRPVLVAYPLSFDWSWLYWYFTRFSNDGSPFNHSRCYDIKTAIAVKSRRTIVDSGRETLPPFLRHPKQHSHHALDDAIEQADIFANVFEWEGVSGDVPRAATR